jgi:hypothetical protein
MKVLRRCRLIERNKKFGLFLDQNDIFPPREMGWRRLSVDGKDAERRAMDMEGMHHTDGENLPNFGCSESDLVVYACQVVGFPLMHMRGPICISFG